MKNLFIMTTSLMATNAMAVGVEDVNQGIDAYSKGNAVWAKFWSYLQDNGLAEWICGVGLTEITCMVAIMLGGFALVTLWTKKFPGYITMILILAAARAAVGVFTVITPELAPGGIIQAIGMGAILIAMIPTIIWAKKATKARYLAGAEGLKNFILNEEEPDEEELGEFIPLGSPTPQPTPQLAAPPPPKPTPQPSPPQPSPSTRPPLTSSKKNLRGGI